MVELILIVESWSIARLIVVETTRLVIIGSIAFSASADGANAFYGLHALNNLDIAVNGKDVNAMPSYQEVRRRQGNGHGNLDSSGGSAEYSPPQPRDAIQCCRQFQDGQILQFGNLMSVIQLILILICL